MADFEHIHTTPRCSIKPPRHDPSCKNLSWSWVCGPAKDGFHKCIHLDPKAAGNKRLVRILNDLGIQVGGGEHYHPQRKLLRASRAHKRA
jgi:hypothetical protein